MTKNTYYSQENLILKGKKRYSKKQIFLKKFISTPIVCSLFTTIIVLFGKALFSSNMLAFNGSTTIFLSTPELSSKDDLFFQSTISGSTMNSDIMSLAVKIYDENGDVYIAPKDIALLFDYHEEKVKIVEADAETFNQIRPYIQKYNLSNDALGELQYLNVNPVHYFISGDKFILSEANIVDEDNNIIENIKLNTMIPEDSEEYIIEETEPTDDKMYARMVCYLKNDNEYLSNQMDKVAKDAAANHFASEYTDEYAISTNRISRDGKIYIIAEGTYVNMQKFNGYILITAIPLTLIIAAVIAIFRTRSEYVALMSHYAIEDYRKDMTNKLAHDLKTPLMAISGYAENLECNINTEKREHYAASIAENVKYMDSIITNVLELSKLDENTVRLAETSFNAANTVNEVLKNYSVQIEKNKLKVFVNGNAEFNTDKNVMHSILDNLISNAVKYTDESGNITIECGKGKITVTNDCKSADTVDTTAIIQPFVKADNSRSGKSGSGLGLSIASKAAERAGLHLSFNTENGKFIAEIAE